MKNLTIRLLAGFIFTFSLFSMSASAVYEYTSPEKKEMIQAEAPAPGVSFFSLILKTTQSSLKKVFRSLLLVNTNLKMAAAFIISAILLRILLYTVFRKGGAFTEILDIGTYVLVLVGIIFFILWFLEAASDF
ncbi:MAG: hypothetical protein K1X92_14345 [Bacteroidia bacterium]|nr:hypothetical protein [Bacteroidia bacterium]